MRTKSMIKNLSTALVIMCCGVATSCKDGVQRGGSSEYKVMEITLSDRSLASNYSATITGRQHVEIRPQVGGFITQVCIEEGAAIKQGQTLFIIDQVPYQAALQTAVANVENAMAQVATAELTVKSKEELYKQDVISEFDLQTAKNSLLMTKAALAQAKAQELIAHNNLSYTVVKSPVNGVASMITYRVGSLVSSSIATPLVTVSDDTEVYVYFSMTENQILALMRENGTTSNVVDAMPSVNLLLNDGSMYDQAGKIDAISGIIDPSTGSISVRATFPNKSKILRSGGAGNIVLPYQKNDCIVIPQAATYEIQDKTFTYKVVDGKASSSPITVFSINNGTEYIVESGLEVGDIIVAEGAGLMREGTAIPTPEINK